MCISSLRRREGRMANSSGFPSRRMSNPASRSGRIEMPKLDREQAISVAALALLLLARADAVREASERREILSRLEAKLRTVSNRPAAVAPPAAFLDASTQGLASAQLQSYLAQLAGDQRASLVSSGGEAAKRDDPPDTIRLQATLDMNLKALRALLYQLESG